MDNKCISLYFITFRYKLVKHMESHGIIDPSIKRASAQKSPSIMNVGAANIATPNNGPAAPPTPQELQQPRPTETPTMTVSQSSLPEVRLINEST